MNTLTTITPMPATRKGAPTPQPTQLQLAPPFAIAEPTTIDPGGHP